jgi:predicted DsbA family dithiol-disulfide isomerase
MSSTKTIPLELYADVVCPWCWIGDRRLAAAIGQLRHTHPEVVFDVTWRPFQLDPTVPAEGRDWAEVVEHKFGGRARAEPMFERVAQAGAGDGIHFAFDRLTRAPNTTKAHALVVHAQQRGHDIWPLVEALFAAYFTHGEDVGDLETLLRIGAAHGLDAAELRPLLANDTYAIDVQQSQKEAARLGVQGVPFLVLDGRYGVSGAQPTEVFVEALQRVASE